MFPSPISLPRPHLRRQRGVVLFISLIVLVAMTLAGIAMIRSVDTGIMISGNLAFKQGATIAADSAMEGALDWLSQPGVRDTLMSDNPGAGYFASWGNKADATFDPAGVTNTPFDWTQSIDLGTDAAGNRVQYVMHRMCNERGQPPSGSRCAMTGQGTLALSTFGSIDYTRQPLATQPWVYYRVTARVTGPRKTYSYVQGFVY